MKKAILISALLTVCYFVLLRPFGVLEISSLKAQDVFFKIRSQVTPHPSILSQIALIVIDDESIEKTNQKWPFRRGVFADLTDRLSKANSRIIAYDFVFSGKSDPVDDFSLSRALEQTDRDVLASFVDTSGNYILPHEEFLKSAAAVGIINKIQDRDLTVRRTKITYLDQQGNGVGLPWEFEIARIAGSLVPSFQAKKIPINYRFDFKKIDAIPFWKLSQDGKLDSKFDGKIVLIGTTSKVLHDFYHTPLGVMPGVVINMNLLANILSNDFIRPLPVVLPGFLLFLLSFTALYISLQYGVLAAFLSFLAISVVYLLLSFALFLKNYSYDYYTPFFFGWLSFIGASIYRYIFTLIENIQLRTKVSIDPLTGLFNRRFLEPTINQELENNAKHELSVLMVDIDNFKSINDTYGHQFGDDVIKNISFSIKEELRNGDVAVRYGGEEFCVILPKTAKSEAAQIGERIRSSIAARKFSYVNQMTQFTVSIGVASSKTDQLTASRALIRAADRALYDAKKSGKNRVALFHNL